MKTKPLLFWIAALGMAAGLVVCSRPTDVTNPSDYRLVQTTRYNVAGRTIEVDTTTYTYDAQGRLAAFASHGMDPKAVRQTTLNYDGQGRIAYVDELLPNGGITAGQQKTVGYRAAYNYDAQGRIEQVIVSAASPDFNTVTRQDDYRFTYGSDPAPTEVRHLRLNTNFYDNYTYTYEQGNIVSARYTSTVLTQPVDYKYEYDDSRNAFRNVARLVPGLEQFNKNNLITGLTPTYDDKGLLIKTTAQGQPNNNVTTFTYEEYAAQ